MFPDNQLVPPSTLPSLLQEDITWDVVTANHCYPFGMLMPGRKYIASSYRYGFMGKETDNELFTEGNSYDFGARMYDSRLGRWLSVDPKVAKYPGVSPYVFCINNPLIYTDPDGKDAIVTIKGNVITVSTTIYIYGKDATAAAARNIQQSIMNNWAKQADGKDWTYTDPATKAVYTVKINVSVQLYNGKEKQDPVVIPDSWNPSSRNNYVEVDNSEKRDHVKGGDKGRWNTKSSQGNAHEWGHLVGLSDEYDDYVDKHSGNIKYSKAHGGWEGNVMGQFYGGVEQKNIDQIVKDFVDNFNITVNNAKIKQTQYNNANEQNKSGSGDGVGLAPVAIPTEYHSEIDKTPENKVKTIKE